MATAAEIAERFREIAHHDFADLPVYRRICLAAAVDPVALDLVGRSRPGQARPVLLLAAVHRLLLDRPDDPLAAWYPMVSGADPSLDDPVPELRRFLREHHDDLAALVSTRGTQTNEVNRSVAVAAALRAASDDLPDEPIALVELGPSAGLNLLADRYAIELADGTVHGHVDSPVRLRCELRGPGRPDLDRPLPPITHRLGLDADPVDVRDPEALRWLEACLWPEQLDRFRRFEAAVALVRDDPPVLRRGDMIEDLPALLDDLPPGRHAVVVHSWSLSYVARDRRPRLADVLAAAAATRPLSWVSIEAPGTAPLIDPPPGPYATILGLTTFRRGHRTSCALARCHHHLAWMEWQPEAR